MKEQENNIEESEQTKTQWTKEQICAIKERHKNILVSAAAGSGKTAVLTERVLSRILGIEDNKRVEIDRFLIVTFTNAAAQEMKERIMQKIGAEIDKLYKSPKQNTKMLEYLYRQMALIPKASISTIHSFCLKTIKAYFNHLNIDPNIKVGEESELKVIKNEILDELIDTYLEEGDADFLKLAEVYGDVNSFDRLKEMIFKLDNFSKSTPFPLDWLHDQVNKLTEDYHSISDTPWAEQFEKRIQDVIKTSLAIYEKAMAICQNPNGPKHYEETIIKDYEQFNAFQYCTTLEEKINYIANIKFDGLSKKRPKCDPSLKAQVKNYREVVKDKIENLKEDLIFLQDDKALSQLPKIGQLMKILVRVIEVFEEKYNEVKKEASIVDYNDLEHYCLRLLVKKDKKGNIVYTNIAKELGQFYKEIYMDEYQDSNEVQELLLKAISEAGREKGPTRFLVGDIKQSIYRFRLANPQIFLDKYRTWDEYQTHLTSKNVVIDLAQNFRSRANILNAVNDIFEQIMSSKVGDIDYDEYAKLKVGNDYTNGLNCLLKEQISEAIELHILEINQKSNTKNDENNINEEDGTEDSIEDLKKVEAEALMVAHLVNDLLQGKGNPTHIYDKEHNIYRPVEPKDIVILLRSVKEKAEIYETALENIGIGSYSENQNSFFETIEIETMISLLKMIDNPLQDIAVLTVLRSPIVGVSFDELALIRKSLPEGYFFEALQVYIESLDKTHRLKHFMKQFEIYREKSSILKIEELIARLYMETGYYHAVSMLPSGTIRKANLDLLRQYAAQYETNQNGQLFGFLHYLDKLKATDKGLESAKLITNNENLVQIMSIHKSKGLEFSIVFLCDTGKQFNEQDLKQELLIHHRLGIAPYYFDTENYIRYPSLPRLAIKERLKAENISEEMRILYVALTRAKEKLFITGTIENLEKSKEKWRTFADRSEKQITSYAMRKYCTYLDWIGMSLYAHQNVNLLRGEEQLAYLFEGESKWLIKVWDKLNLSQNNDEKVVEDRKSLLENWDTKVQYSPYKTEIERRLNFVYPYQQSITLPTKVSVSEIKRNHQVEEDTISLFDITSEQTLEPPKPNFIEEKVTAKGARRGTLLHSIFEQLDYLKYTTEEAIQQELKRLVQENKIEEEALKVVSIKRLAQMSQSPLIEKMRRAYTVEKEKAFIYLAPAPLVDASYPKDEQILIQGIIDAYFIDEEGITLIDYKTDYIDNKNQKQSILMIKKRYEKQIALYAIALENLLKLPVVHKVIYLYNINEFIAY